MFIFWYVLFLDSRPAFVTQKRLDVNQRWTEGNTRQGLVRGALCADDRTDSDAGKFASRKKEKREDVGGENTSSLIMIVWQYLLEADWDNFLIRLITDFWSLSGRADRIPTKPWWLQTLWLEPQVLKMSCLIVDSSGWICENEAFLRDVLRHCAVLFHRVRVPPKLRSCRSSFKVDQIFSAKFLDICRSNWSRRKLSRTSWSWCLDVFLLGGQRNIDWENFRDVEL